MDSNLLVKVNSARFVATLVVVLKSMGDWLLPPQVAKFVGQVAGPYKKNKMTNL